jgi:hypothetical protein
VERARSCAQPLLHPPPLPNPVPLPRVCARICVCVGGGGVVWGPVLEHVGLWCICLCVCMWGREWWLVGLVLSWEHVSPFPPPLPLCVGARWGGVGVIQGWAEGVLRLCHNRCRVIGVSKATKVEPQSTATVGDPTRVPGCHPPGWPVSRALVGDPTAPRGKPPAGAQAESGTRAPVGLTLG